MVTDEGVAFAVFDDAGGVGVVGLLEGEELWLPLLSRGERHEHQTRENEGESHQKASKGSSAEARR